MMFYFGYEFSLHYLYLQAICDQRNWWNDKHDFWISADVIPRHLVKSGYCGNIVIVFLCGGIQLNLNLKKVFWFIPLKAMNKLYLNHVYWNFVLLTNWIVLWILCILVSTLFYIPCIQLYETIRKLLFC